MKKIKKNSISGTAFVWALLSFGGAHAWADQLAQAPVAPPPAAPPAGAPPARRRQGRRRRDHRP